MIWTMKPTAKKLEDVETKVGNVGSTDLQSQVTTLNNKVGNVGSTDLQSQVNTLNSNMSYLSLNDGTLYRLNATDLNTIKRTGNYYANYNCSNCIAGGGYLQVQAYSTSYVKQFMQKYNGSGYFTRQCNNGTWSDWVELAQDSKLTNNDITTLAAVNGITCRYVVRGGFCFIHLNGTPTNTTNIQFTVPRALLGSYVTSGQWGNTGNVFQVFIDENATVLNVRNHALISMNVNIVYPVAY